MHDPRLLDQLSRYPTRKFDDTAYRATPQTVSPLTPSTAGGRWSPRGSVPVLYTSVTREGALAEISYHWSLLDPTPTKDVALHQLRVTTQKTLKLVETDLANLGVAIERFHELSYLPTQAIGAAVAFLGYDGLMVPSARWKTENLVLFAENETADSRLELSNTELIQWQPWAKTNGFLD